MCRPLHEQREALVAELLQSALLAFRCSGLLYHHKVDCLKCNGEKSALEHYLTTIMLAGGPYPDGDVMMFDRLPRKLENTRNCTRPLPKDCA